MLISQNQLRPAIQRDPRIDFFRGIALYMVLVDHIPWDPIARVTYRNFGFSTAAYIFFFLSGVSCGIAYSRVLARSGWLGLLTATTKRAAKIYLFYLLSSLVIISIAMIAPDGVRNYLFLWIPEHPVNAIKAAIVMLAPTPFTFILPVYVILTLVVTPLFLAGAKHSARLTLGLSGLIWIICQFHPNVANLSKYFYFNPIAWQFLFSIGIYIGMKYTTPPRILIMIQGSRWILMAAWVIVIASFLYARRFLFSSQLHLNLDWLQIPDRLDDVQELAVLGLLHFLSVALLVSIYFKVSHPMFRWVGAQLIMRAGRHSLELYSLSTVLSTLVGFIVAFENVSLVSKLALDSLAILFIALTANALMDKEVIRRPQEGVDFSSP